MSFDLRPVEPHDTQALQSLIGGIYAEYDVVLDLEDVDHHLVAPGPWFRRPGGECWVLDEPAQPVVACVAVKLLDCHVAELKSLYVHPRLRRRGLASGLTAHVEAYALNAGRRRVELWSDTRFGNAHLLYRHLGYTQEGERDLGDWQNTREYGFFKDLLPPRVDN